MHFSLPHVGKRFDREQDLSLGNWKKKIVQKALYGLKSSSAAFRSFLAGTLDDIGFRSSIADPDVCMRAAIKPDGEAYYEYILCYVDAILCISHNAERPMKQIGNTTKFKGNKIVEPKLF